MFFKVALLREATTHLKVFGRHQSNFGPALPAGYEMSTLNQRCNGVYYEGELYMAQMNEGVKQPGIHPVRQEDLTF